MQRLLFPRIAELNLVQNEAVRRRAKEIGAPFRVMEFLSEERVRSLLSTNLSKEAQIAEGIACIAELLNPEVQEAQIVFPTDDPAKVFKTLKDLVTFAVKQVGIEEEVQLLLNEAEEAVNAFQSDAQPFEIENAQYMQPSSFEDVLNCDWFSKLENLPSPMQVDHDISSMHQVVEKLSKVVDLFHRHIINRYKSFQIYEQQRNWSDCPKIYDLLTRMVNLALRLYAIYVNAGADIANIDGVLLNIFNDCFLVQTPPPRFIIYKPDKKRGLEVEFQHLLSAFFTPETPILSLVDEDQVGSVFSREVGSYSCAQVTNDLVTVVEARQTEEGPTSLAIKFSNVKIGNPRPCGGQEGEPKKKTGRSPSKVGVSETKYWPVCEMVVGVHGWRSVKLTSLSLSIIIGTHTCQGPLSWVTIRYENAGFSRKRGHFMAKQALHYKKILKSFNQEKMSELWEPCSEINYQCLHDALLEIATPCHQTVSLEQLHKAKIPSMGITFYDFSYGQLDLAVSFDDLKQLWQNGLVVGWVKRNHMHLLLQRCPIGTLLIRAGLSQKAITITWTYQGGVASLEPLKRKDLEEKGLVERIQQIAPRINLSSIYPDYSPAMLSSPNKAPPSPPPSPPLEDEHLANPVNLMARSYTKLVCVVDVVYPTDPEQAQP